MKTAETEIIDGNKLIAKFMGIMVTDFKWKTYHTLVYCDENGEWDFSYLEYYNPHSDWNRLMPVIEKIEASGYIVEIWLSLGKGCKIFKPNYEPSVSFSCESNSTIEAVWMTIVEFLEWHNKESKVQGSDTTILPKD